MLNLFFFLIFFTRILLFIIVNSAFFLLSGYTRLSRLVDSSFFFRICLQSRPYSGSQTVRLWPFRFLFFSLHLGRNKCCLSVLRSFYDSVMLKVLFLIFKHSYWKLLDGKCMKKKIFGIKSKFYNFSKISISSNFLETEDDLMKFLINFAFKIWKLCYF